MNVVMIGAIAKTMEFMDKEAINLLKKGLKGYVVFLFHTGCGMVLTTGYPYTSFRSIYT